MIHKPTNSNLIAFGWGLAEATVFFIVPDVYIGYRGLKSARAALLASAWAIGGAFVGGLIMYAWSSHNATATLDLVRHVPAVTPSVIRTAQNGYGQHGVWALFAGMVYGVPYKVYAVLAHSRHIAFPMFMFVSILARASRFVLVGLIVAGLSNLLGRWVNYRGRLGIYVAFWVVFYAGYFATHR